MFYTFIMFIYIILFVLIIALMISQGFLIVNFEKINEFFNIHEKEQVVKNVKIDDEQNLERDLTEFINNEEKLSSTPIDSLELYEDCV